MGIGQCMPSQSWMRVDSMMESLQEACRAGAGVHEHPKPQTPRVSGFSAPCQVRKDRLQFSVQDRHVLNFTFFQACIKYTYIVAGGVGFFLANLGKKIKK